ncbi:hypothetical protein EXN22_14605 [Pseudomonas tructae]|uniref:Glycoside hydrolase family 19 catalytic domain-containing protein n=1 Tax=Pseudomonas tructae TaxID=2518644 RepID=A0A411MJ87_9PSED|nr:hypothetical protein [Pseudomonas tructae]QBF26859.1 hypothetical protein EXN22_14605 [Pseudomonas tructae]
MSPLSEQLLLQIFPNARPVAGIFLPALNRAIACHKINSPLRVAAFLAQIGHESGQLRNLVESLNYSVESLLAKFSRDRISETDAKAYGRAAGRPANQQTIANCVYGGAWGTKSLGNKRPGDGWLYRGRGMIQITGLVNYIPCAAALGLLGHLRARPLDPECRDGCFRRKTDDRGGYKFFQLQPTTLCC